MRLYEKSNELFIFNLLVKYINIQFKLKTYLFSLHYLFTQLCFYSLLIAWKEYQYNLLR